MNNYFVTTQGEEAQSNLSKQEAIKEARKLIKGGSASIGIGTRKTVKGQSFYKLLPASFFL